MRRRDSIPADRTASEDAFVRGVHEEEDDEDEEEKLFGENPVNSGNYRNCTRRSESLVTRSNTGYYHASAGVITTCRKWVGKSPFFGTIAASLIKEPELSVLEAD